MKPCLRSPYHYQRDKNELMVTHSISEGCFISDWGVSYFNDRATLFELSCIISIPLDRPRERSMTETKAFARICAMVKEALGSGELEEDASIKE